MQSTVPARKSQPFYRLKYAIAAASLLYAAWACFILSTIPRSTSIRTVPDWIAVPSQLLAIVSALIVIVELSRSRGQIRAMWSLVCAFGAMSLIATYMWNEFRVFGNDRALSFADGCYFIDYALMTAAYGVAFQRLGGSFRNLRTWLDGLTILVALLATFWATMLGPFSPPGQSQPTGLLFGGSYLLSIAALITMASLLFLQLPRASWRTVEFLLIAAGIVDVIWELAWLENWVRHLSFIGLYYNFGDVLCFTIVACAAAMTPRQPEPDSERTSAVDGTHPFFPVLSALLATALIGAFLASTRATDVWILVGLVILTGLLLLTRQAAVRRQLDALNRALALRAADARLSELVRQSADAFLIVDSHEIIAFASPTTEAVLRVPPARLAGTRAQDFLGSVHEAALRVFLDQLVSAHGAPQPLEVTFASRTGSLRVLRISGMNLLANPNVRGLGLTVTDISALRQLEREVLEAANLERVRLAGDIHEGLGQQLTGIMMMLQGAAKTPDLNPAVQKQYLDTIVQLVGEAIHGTRALARGLSPIYVGGGSLCGALLQLGKDSGVEPPVRIEIDPSFDDRIVDDFHADHLFRIAQEAVHNARRHSHCTQTDVALQIAGDRLVLTIRDDGCGCDFLPQTSCGFGLRLMEYRARVIGGSFSIGRGSQAGTLVQTTVPLRYLSAEGAPE